jgi:alpha-galactosidase
MRPLNIVIIGAGSANFGLNSVATLLREPELCGSTLALVDTNGEGLEFVHRLSERINHAWDAGLTIKSSTDRCAVLEGADFVVCAIEVGPREELWRQDWETTLRHGLRQPYAENGGPGGFAHAARNIPHFLNIARDMEQLCPKALFVILSNPVPRLCRAVAKYTSITPVGLCHQIIHGYFSIGRLMSDRIGVPIPEVMQDPQATQDEAYWRTFHVFLDHVAEVVDLKAAGLNHFTWMLDVRDRRSGEDLYPELKERFAAEKDSPDPLTQDILRLTACLAVPGDSHLSEYLTYAHNPATKPWERYHLPLFEWDDAAKRRNELWDRIRSLILDEDADLDSLRQVRSEGVYEVIHGVAHDAGIYRTSINVTNNGSVSNLPAQTIVEVPAIVSGMGVLPLRVGGLPRVVAEFCRREAERVELVVDAAALGSREHALQALALDPTVDDLDVAKAVLDDYLDTQREHLPQFHGQWSL